MALKDHDFSDLLKTHHNKLLDGIGRFTFMIFICQGAFILKVYCKDWYVNRKYRLLVVLNSVNLLSIGMYNQQGCGEIVSTPSSLIRGLEFEFV